jgi:hypothetical protein
MQLHVDIEFDQLVEMVKTLPTGKLRQLKVEIENEAKKTKTKVGLRTLLLHGPVATKNK